jgi:hypothetical protein
MLQSSPNSMAIVKGAPLEVQPLQPLHGVQHDVCLINSWDQQVFGLCEGCDLLVCRDCQAPLGIVILDEGAQKSRQVGSDTVDPHSVKVDDSTHGIPAKEHMVVPNISQAEL